MSDQLPTPDRKTSMMELFDRDPLQLTREDLDQMVEVLRAQRHIWANETQQARSQNRRRSSAVVKELPMGNDAEF